MSGPEKRRTALKSSSAAVGAVAQARTANAMHIVNSQQTGSMQHQERARRTRRIRFALRSRLPQNARLRTRELFTWQENEPSSPIFELHCVSCRLAALKSR